MNELLGYLKQGGVIMIPIVVFSVVALAVFLERLWSLRIERVIPRTLPQLVQQKVSQNKPAEALALCETSKSSMSVILIAGLKRFGRSRSVVKESFEEVGRLEVNELSRLLK